MLAGRVGKEVVLEEHGVRVGAVQAPLAVVMREVAHNHDVVCERAAVGEVAVEHDARPGGSGVVFLGSAVAGDLEALEDDVVGGPEEHHPAPAVRRARPIDDDGPRAAERHEPQIAAIARAGLVADYEPLVGAREHGYEVAALGGIGRLLQGAEHARDRQFVCDPGAPGPLGSLGPLTGGEIEPRDAQGARCLALAGDG